MYMVFYLYIFMYVTFAGLRIFNLLRHQKNLCMSVFGMCLDYQGECVFSFFFSFCFVFFVSLFSSSSERFFFSCFILFLKSQNHIHESLPFISSHYLLYLTSAYSFISLVLYIPRLPFPSSLRFPHPFISHFTFPHLHLFLLVYSLLPHLVPSALHRTT